MSTVAPLVAIITGCVSGLVLGVAHGFASASHAAVLAGTNHRPANRFVAFLARRTAGLRLREYLVFLLLMAAWLVLFFVLIALPLIVGALLHVPEGWWTLASYIALFITAFLTLPLGRRIWWRS